MSPPDDVRCRRCGWPIVPEGEQGCWESNCSTRPLPPLPVQHPLTTGYAQVEPDVTKPQATGEWSDVWERGGLTAAYRHSAAALAAAVRDRLAGGPGDLDGLRRPLRAYDRAADALPSLAVAAARSNPTPAEGAGWTDITGGEVGDEIGIPLGPDHDEAIDACNAIARCRYAALATPQPPKDTARLREAVQMAAERFSIEGQARLSKDNIEAALLRAKVYSIARDLFAALSASPEAQEPKS